MVWFGLPRMICSLMMAAPLAPAGPPVPDGLDLSIICRLPVQADGRYPPLDTLARQTVELVTGSRRFGGHDPLALVLAWTFQPDAWLDEPLIPIDNVELRRAIGLDESKRRFSYRDLHGHHRLQQMLSELHQRADEKKRDPLTSKLNRIEKQLTRLQRVFGEDLILAVPHPSDATARWSALSESAIARVMEASSESRIRPELLEPVRTAWAALRESFLAGDNAAFLEAAGSLLAALRRLPAAYYPDPALIELEIRYNRLQPFRAAWMVLGAAALVSLLALLARRFWSDMLALLALTAGAGLTTYGLAMRWQIAGRIPAANMYESLLLLGWGMGAFGIGSVVFARHRIVPLNASALAALALLLADCLPLDRYIGPIPPVLRDTIWMSIHVPIIMASYSVLAMAMLLGHGQLLVAGLWPKRTGLIHRIDNIQYGYLLVGSFLLAAGIVTGSIWGASSWGRYWGWDPKEVWSLIALLGYMAVLHGRAARWLGTFGTAMGNVLAFWLVVMTYIGVNYILGVGLHSYAFGTGTVARWLLAIGAVELAFLAAVAVVRLRRARLVSPIAASPATAQHQPPEPPIP